MLLAINSKRIPKTPRKIPFCKRPNPWPQLQGFEDSLRAKPVSTREDEFLTLFGFRLSKGTPNQSCSALTALPLRYWRLSQSEDWKICCSLKVSPSIELLIPRDKHLLLKVSSLVHWPYYGVLIHPGLSFSLNRDAFVSACARSLWMISPPTGA